MKILYILIVFVYCLLPVDGVGYFPCRRQELGQYVGVIGPVRGVLHFSCKHPSKFILDGKATDLVSKAGPFLLLRRSGNEFTCAKEMAIEPKGQTFIVYILPWIKRYNNPELCDVCTASGNWTIQMFVASNTDFSRMNRVVIPPLGCNVPLDCPITNTYTNIPCTGCETDEDNGLCCSACQRNKNM